MFVIQGTAINLSRIIGFYVIKNSINFYYQGSGQSWEFKDNAEAQAAFDKIVASLEEGKAVCRL